MVKPAQGHHIEANRPKPTTSTAHIAAQLFQQFCSNRRVSLPWAIWCWRCPNAPNPCEVRSSEYKICLVSQNCNWDTCSASPPLRPARPARNPVPVPTSHVPSAESRSQYKRHRRAPSSKGRIPSLLLQWKWTTSFASVPGDQQG